tara:strand:- start:195 stop:1154 length:960 start_codon:yes stop_codon:yes gene_type:complete
MKKKIILITGAAGMMGSELIEKLINDNYLIIGIDNFRLGKKKFIKNYLKLKNFFFFNIDLSKKIRNSRLENLIKKNILYEIWHFAANSDIQNGIKDKKVDLNNTFLTTFYSINFLKKFINKKTKIIFSSSSAIYGKVDGKINEKTLPLYPTTNYGSMKLASESFLTSFAINNKIKLYIFRFPNVVGKNLTHGIMYDFKKKFSQRNKFVNVLGNGNQRKPYSFSSEILDCMKYTISKSHKFLINHYNIGPNDQGIKVREIVKVFQKFFPGKKIRYEKKEEGWLGDVTKYKYDTKKINKLGFKFTFNSRMAIKKVVKSFFI